MAGQVSGAWARRIRFGPFEADAAAGELRNNGRLIRLQEQPFQILLALLERAGEVITREELRHRLWPDDTFGDFDQGLNTAINKLREALGDSAATPKFVETVPKRGYRFIHELESEPPAPPPPRARPRVPWHRVAGAAAVLFGILIVSLSRRTAEAPIQLPLRRFSFEPAVPVASRVFNDPVLAVSPNGRYIAYVTDESPSRIFVHDLEQGIARVFSGTEGGRSPFWSPDSEFFGFAAGEDLKKVRLRDGSPRVLCRGCASGFYGAAWSPDGQSIVFAEGAPSNLFEVPATGGARRLLLTAEKLRYRQSGLNPKEMGYLSGPKFLPQEAGRRVILFAVGYAAATLVVRDLDTGREEVLWPTVIWAGGSGLYSKSGHVLYRPPQGSAEIWARPFSLRTLKTAGEAFQVIKGGVDISLADDGTLIYVDALSAALNWLNRKGARIASVGQPLEGFFYPALSSDGLRAAVETNENSNLDIWVYDLERGARTRLTSHPATDIVPVWSPDSQRIAFSSYRPGNMDVFLAPADGSAGDKAIVSSPNNERVSDWSSDGRRILYSVTTAENGFDIWYAEFSGGNWKLMPFLQTRSNEFAAKLSPDGRYIAYVSNETGRDEIFVRPFPAGDGKWPISTNGGKQVRWRRDGRELFYTDEASLIGVSLQTAPDFRPGVPVVLFSNPAFQVPGWEAHYDVAPDGQRFLVPERLGGARKIHFVQNWFAAFRK
jgi:Tol biopolymer transport system component/DNA-binding winged helix-turn-helix (wHTH) protein